MSATGIWQTRMYRDSHPLQEVPVKSNPRVQWITILLILPPAYIERCPLSFLPYVARNE